jgi:hypothetical protein
MDMRAEASYAARWKTEGTSGETTVTESEWLECTEPEKMLEFLRGKVSERKLRLFAVACCRRCLHLVPPDCLERHYSEGRPWVALIQQAIQVGEELADGDATQHSTMPGIDWTWLGSGYAFLSCAGPTNDLPEVSEYVAWAVGELVSDSNEHYTATEKAEYAAHAQLLRDICGNALRPVSLNPAWLSWHNGLLVSMAQKMYDCHDFSDLPVLADALEEAGCANQDILSHCRSGGEHVRGCWVVDLLLGKE